MAPRGIDRFADAASLGEVCTVANNQPVWLYAEDREALDFEGQSKGILPPGSKVRLLDVDAGGRSLVEVISTPKLWIGSEGEEVVGSDAQDDQGGNGGPVSMSRLNSAPAGGLRAVMHGAWRSTSTTLQRNPLDQRSLRVYVPPPRIAEASVPPENQCEGGRLPRGWVVGENAPGGNGCILRPIREGARDYLRPWQEPPPRPSSAPRPPRPSTALADVNPERAKRLRALSRETRKRTARNEAVALPVFASVYRDSPYVGRPAEAHVRNLRHYGEDILDEDAPPFCGVVGRGKTEQVIQLRATAAAQTVSIRPPDEVKGGEDFAPNNRPSSAPKAWGGRGPSRAKASELNLDSQAANLGIVYEKMSLQKESPPVAAVAGKGFSRNELEQMVIELEEANAAARARLAQIDSVTVK